MNCINGVGNILSKIVRNIIFNWKKYNVPDGVLYSCVLDDTALFYWQGYIFINALLKLAHVNGSRIFVHMTQRNPQFESFLDSNDVNIKFITPWGDKKHCNKLQQVETVELQEAEYVFLCDADLAILRDLSCLASSHGDQIVGKAVDFGNPALDKLKYIFDYFDLEYPPVNFDTLDGAGTFDGNFNGGLYGIPGSILKNFGKAWKRYAIQMLKSNEIRRHLGDKSIHVDQISFALALKFCNYPYFRLGNSDNCPVHISNKDLMDRNIKEEVNVVHFHHRLDERGFIRQTGNSFSDKAIKKINHVLHRAFHNSLFWNFRYSMYPALGSGAGSRGRTADIKLELLKAIGVQRFESVLDIGCGDVEVIKNLAVQNYIGADISSEAIKNNKTLYPEASFYLLPFEREKIKKCDLVLCLDVLIHQTTKDDYHDLMDLLVENTKTRLVVSGYTDTYDKSHMCFFHENIYDSLNRSGEFASIYKIGEYRGLDVVVADKVLAPYFSHEANSANDIRNSVVCDYLTTASYSWPDLLSEAICVSRSCFGWFTKHLPRLHEYPWLLSKLGRNLNGITIVDFGAGVSPLPIMLHIRGANVHTIDNSQIEVDVSQVDNHNEWGFLDYSQSCRNINSHHAELTETMFENHSIDVFYAISVIEHMSAEARRRIFNIVGQILKENGSLFLTIDLDKNSDNLWNYSEGKPVENNLAHGNLLTLKEELTTTGFKNISITKQVMPDSQRVDIAFIAADIIGG